MDDNYHDKELGRYNKAVLLGCTPLIDENGQVTSDCTGKMCIITGINNTIRCLIRHDKVVVTAKELDIGVSPYSAPGRIICNEMVIHSWDVIKDCCNCIEFEKITINEPIAGPVLLNTALRWILTLGRTVYIDWKIEYESSWFREIDIVEMIDFFTGKYCKEQSADSMDRKVYSATSKIFLEATVLRMLDSTCDKLRKTLINDIDTTNRIIRDNKKDITFGAKSMWETESKFIKKLGVL